VKKETSLFRPAALKHVGAPDQLHVLCPVTPPRTWIALAACTVVIVSGLSWSTRATVPLTVRGQGILLKSGGVLEVVSNDGGRVTDIAVRVGELVREGQVVARVAHPDLADRLRQAKAALERAGADREIAYASSTKARDLELEGLARQRSDLQASIKADTDTLAWLTAKVESQELLVQQGRLTKQTLFNTVHQKEDTLEQIRSRTTDLVSIGARELQAGEKFALATRDADRAVREAHATIDKVDLAIRDASEIHSPYTGRVIELLADQGALIPPGDSILSLDPAGRTVVSLEAVVYVAAKDGKLVKPGMRVQIAPAIVRPEEYGYLLGTVNAVSEFPTTSRGMLRVLKNKDLIGALSGGGAPHELHIDLLPDPTTTSQLKWSSGGGPPIHVVSGTLCVADITYDERRPIELAVPFLTQAGGR
jgi:HlyD family secretion protein